MLDLLPRLEFSARPAVRHCASQLILGDQTHAPHREVTASPTPPRFRRVQRLRAAVWALPAPRPGGVGAWRWSPWGVSSSGQEVWTAAATA